MIAFTRNLEDFRGHSLKQSPTASCPSGNAKLDSSGQLLWACLDDASTKQDPQLGRAGKVEVPPQVLRARYQGRTKHRKLEFRVIKEQTYLSPDSVQIDGAGHRLLIQISRSPGL